MRNDFVALILTHGRADNVKTYDSLRKHGYTGRIVLVIDNEDDQADEYYSIYGKEDVVMFNKAEKAKVCDVGDNFGKRNVVLFARNSCHEIARQLGYRYFIELDDDYASFSFRHDSQWVFREKNTYQLDGVFEMMVWFLQRDERIKAVCMTQHGDYVGGAGGSFGDIKLHRKAMNAFVCDVERPFQFYGYLNEDTTTYTLLGGRGDIFFTLPTICLGQAQTQLQRGGADRGVFGWRYLQEEFLHGDVLPQYSQDFGNGCSRQAHSPQGELENSSAEDNQGGMEEEVKWRPF